MDNLILALGLALAVSLLLVALLGLMWRGTRARLQASRFSSQSLSTKYGKMTEQFMPFVETFPWDPQRFRFIGSPIDGVQFEDDKIIFVEFKVASSHLSARQRRIRDLIQAGHVEFKEFRLD